MKLTYIYYILLVACFINSLYFLHNNKVKVLAILLFLSILTELLAEINIYKKVNYYLYYHAFTLVEYALISGIMYLCIRNKLFRNLVLISIPLFAVACTLILLFLQDIKQMPSMSGGLEGTLVIVWCLRAFYDIDVEGRKRYFSRLHFGLSWGSIVIIASQYHLTVFLTLCRLIRSTCNFDKAFAVINSAANYLLYILCIIGLSCLKRTKFIPRSS